MELSAKWPVKRLCSAMSVSRSGFYKWKDRLADPAPRTKKRTEDIALFQRYHGKYPSHGYRWLNAKIRLDAGIVLSDQYAHRCCMFAAIKSEAKHHAYKTGGEEKRIFPNLVMASMKADGPMQVVVSDMTAFRAGRAYWELTLYMDLWDNEIVGYGLSSRKGDPNTYYDGLKMVAERKKGMEGLGLILHTDQGSVYSSKGFNELLPQHSITHSMSRAGTPTDNGAMEAINGWAKPEMFVDFGIGESEDVPKAVEEYIRFFNEARPSYALGYLTPAQFKEKYAGKPNQPKKPSKVAYERKEAKIKKANAEKVQKNVRIPKCLLFVDQCKNANGSSLQNLCD